MGLFSCNDGLKSSSFSTDETSYISNRPYSEPGHQSTEVSALIRKKFPEHTLLNRTKDEGSLIPTLTIREIPHL